MLDYILLAAAVAGITAGCYEYGVHKRQLVFKEYLAQWPHGCAACAFQKLAQLERMRCPVRFHRCRCEECKGDKA